MSRPLQRNSVVRRVHLIFKTHLDLGFTDFARIVADRYFEVYIPHALRVAEEMRRSCGPERFVWTTGSWLIYEFLERASPPQRAQLERAILNGDIAWHGLPFTTHSELMDAELFRFGLSLARELDARFGKHTIAAKMTDVPGHTRGIVPLLAEAGIQFLHIGVNAASTPPAVPSTFRWRAPDGAEVMVMYQKGAYGDLQIVLGLDEALAFAHTSDNVGPQTAAQVQAAYAGLREKLPGAEIVASTMDEFARALVRVKAQLPVVEQEIGDTWIHGAGTDPKKTSAFRELLRLRRQWVNSGQVDPRDAAYRQFSRALLKIPEHTWGLDVKTHLADYVNYANALFDAARDKPNFQKMEASWQEQRAYVDEAVAALPRTPWGDEARRALASRAPARPSLADWSHIDDPFAPVETRRWQFRLDARGAVVSLQDRATRRRWADAKHPLALFCYETFSAADYARFYKQYVVHRPENAWWSVPDLTKPGLEATNAEHRDWFPRLAALYRDPNSNLPRYLVELAMPEQAVAQYGCPALVFLIIELPEEELSIRFTLQWFGKRACRLPEAIWLSFAPRIPSARGWTMDKLGQAISPLDVVRDGNRHLHAVGRGVTYRAGELAFEIETRDAPLVAPGERALLTFTNRQPPLERGMHFLLYDNLWGTNFPMWYEDDARFEFVFRRLQGKPGAERG